jgi:hypothetical protein
MKRIILIAITIITNLTFGQETGTYQSDSIYKRTKLKRDYGIRVQNRN